MKTKEEIITAGYGEDWATECPICHTWYCHKYSDCTYCFECKKRVVMNNINTGESEINSINGLR